MSDKFNATAEASHHTLFIKHVANVNFNDRMRSSAVYSCFSYLKPSVK